MESRPFTLIDFKMTRSAQFRAFTVWWRDQHESSPERFPRRLSFKQWEERYQDWCVSVNSDDFDPDLTDETLL